MEHIALFAATESGIFTELAIIIALGSGVALLMRLLKQPLIIGHIITGILVGPSVFNLIHSEDTVEVFASIGITLLLFIIGLGLNPKVIKEVGRVAALAGLAQIAVTTILGFFILLALDYSQQHAGLIAVAIAFSSTIIVLKLISDKKEQTRLYAKISIGILLVQDIIATLALLFLTTSADGGLSFNSLMLLIAKGTTLGGIIALISIYVLPRMKELIAGSQEFLFLFALGWGFGIAALFEQAGFSLEIGALFAGIGLANQTFTQEMSARLRPVRDFFVVVFFIVLGSEITLDNLTNSLVDSMILSAMVIVLNPLTIMAVLGAVGYTKKTSFFTAISMAQISEFSLVFIILAERQGRISEEVLSMVTLTALITIAISTYMIIYSDKLFAYFSEHLRLFERHKVQFDQEQADAYPIVLFGYKKGGSEFISVFKSMKKKFVVVDYDPEVIDTLEAQKVHYMYGDATDIELLDEIGMEKAKLIVSTVTDHDTNMFLTTHSHALNPKAVIICHSDTTQQAQELYDHGASYVMMSHAIGSEKIGSFIKRNGFKRSEFAKFRERHLGKIATASSKEA